MKQFIRVSAYGLIVRGERILLCRISPSTLPTQEWTLPGGGIDFGEHPEKAAVREILEETGFHVTLSGRPHVDSDLIGWRDATGHAIRLIYNAQIIGGELTHEVNGSTDRCDWFTRSEALALPLVPLGKLGIELVLGLEP
ncbi:MAG: NUDIX hydrolase [Fimbriimonadales bacterium]